MYPPFPIGAFLDTLLERVVIETSSDKCHVNRAVCDNNWEAMFCRIVDADPRVISYVKNHGLGLEVPYLDGNSPRTYVPDFIVQVDDGNGPDDPLNLIAEVKGYRGEAAVAKATTMESYWIPGVNNLGCYGRWAFHEFTSTDRMMSEFDAVVQNGTGDAPLPTQAHYSVVAHTSGA